MSDCYGNIHQIHPKYSPRLENREKRDLPIRLMFGNVQWSVKKMRLFFAFFPFIVTSAPALNISNFSSDVPSQKQLSNSHTQRASPSIFIIFWWYNKNNGVFGRNEEGSQFVGGERGQITEIVTKKAGLGRGGVPEIFMVFTMKPCDLILALKLFLLHCWCFDIGSITTSRKRTQINSLLDSSLTVYLTQIWQFSWLSFKI